MRCLIPRYEYIGWYQSIEKKKWIKFIVYFRLVVHAVAVNYSLFFARELPILADSSRLILPFRIHTSSADIKSFMEISFNCIRKTIHFGLIRLNNFIGDLIEQFRRKSSTKLWLNSLFAFCNTFKLFFSFQIAKLFLLRSLPFLASLCRDIFVT